MIRFEKYAIHLWPKDQEMCGCRSTCTAWLLGCGPRRMFSVEMEVHECDGCGATWTYEDFHLQPSWQVRPVPLPRECV